MFNAAEEQCLFLAIQCMRKLNIKIQIKRVVVSSLCVIGVLIVIFIRSMSCAHQARFNVDVLERYIQLYHLEHSEYPAALPQIRPIDVVAFGESLALNSRDLEKREWRGYHYAYQRLDKDKFVLSASPVGFFPARIEFGTTEDGFLRFNTEDVDSAYDSAEEVQEWQAFRRSEGVVTRPQ